MNRKGMDQGGRGLIEVIYQNLPGRIEQNHESLKDSQFLRYKHHTNTCLVSFR
jgi:hypothetical protein